MAGQLIKNANIFGRIGSGIGQGLGQQLPKEIENQRLKSGLRDLAEKSTQGNLNPAQFQAEASGIYGITPQMIQSFGELAKIQNQGNAYRAGAGNKENVNQENLPASPSFRDVQFGQDPSKQFGQNQGMGQKMSPVGQVNNQQQTPNSPSNQNTPQVIEGNTLNERNLPKLPYTPQQRQAGIAKYIDQGFLPNEAKQLQEDDERRDLAEPGVHKQRLEDIETAKGKVRDALKRHLETKLQKSGDATFKDVEGRMQLNAERGMTRDLIKNPKADIDNVANDWSERLYNTAIAKGKLKTLGKTTGIENLFKGNTSAKKLNEYQDIFKRSGNLDEFNNILQGPDFGMSPQVSETFAYPPNPKVSKNIASFKPINRGFYDPASKMQEARKIAIEIEDSLGPDDSLLAIARSLSDKDPLFDQQSFFDQMSEDKDKIGLNERQRQSLAEGVRDIIPNWADILYIPSHRRL